MDFYVIPPNSRLELMHLGKRYFCLAQHYLNNEKYRQFFKEVKKTGAWITLDNGAGDHALITEQLLLECTEDLMPNEVIPPDTLFDSFTTLEALNSFISKMDSKLKDRVEIFGCPQGNTQQEWIDCYLEMLANPAVKTIGMSKLGIPHAFLGKAENDQGIMESRHLAVDYLLTNDLIQKPLHFLGMGSPLEMEKYKKLNNSLFRSTDSCNTVWSGMNNLDWSNSEFQRMPTPKDYFERQVTEDQLTFVLSNINWFNNFLL